MFLFEGDLKRVGGGIMEAWAIPYMKQYGPGYRILKNNKN